MASNRLRFMRIIALLAVVLLLAVGCQGGDSRDETHGDRSEPLGKEPRGTVFAAPEPAPGFQLTDQDGQPFRLSDHQGQVVALFFGYTHCPDICPLTLGFITSAASQLGDDAANVRFVFISVDPERDSSERLNDYLSRIDTEVVGLTGSPDEVARVAADYDILVEKQPRDDGSYLVNHSAHMTLIDQAGNLKIVVPMGSDGDDLLNDIRWLLQHKAEG